MDIGLTRLANQRIIDRPFTQPADVVAWLGAMQAQDYLGALWAIGLRMAKAPQPPTERLVEQAIADRTIIRTWPMRGTLHFVAAADVRWLLQLLTPRQIKQSAATANWRWMIATRCSIPSMPIASVPVATAFLVPRW